MSRSETRKRTIEVISCPDDVPFGRLAAKRARADVDIGSERTVSNRQLIDVIADARARIASLEEFVESLLVGVNPQHPLHAHSDIGYALRTHIQDVSADNDRLFDLVIEDARSAAIEACEDCVNRTATTAVAEKIRSGFDAEVKECIVSEMTDVVSNLLDDVLSERIDAMVSRELKSHIASLSDSSDVIGYRIQERINASLNRTIEERCKIAVQDAVLPLEDRVDVLENQ